MAISTEGTAMYKDRASGKVRKDGGKRYQIVRRYSDRLVDILFAVSLVMVVALVVSARYGFILQ